MMFNLIILDGYIISYAGNGETFTLHTFLDNGTPLKIQCALDAKEALQMVDEVPAWLHENQLIRVRGQLSTSGSVYYITVNKISAVS